MPLKMKKRKWKLSLEQKAERVCSQSMATAKNALQDLKRYEAGYEDVPGKYTFGYGPYSQTKPGGFSSMKEYHAFVDLIYQIKDQQELALTSPFEYIRTLGEHFINTNYFEKNDE
jgi:hypothetical protein